LDKKLIDLFAGYEIIPTFAGVIAKWQDDSKLYIHSTMWQYYSTGKG
jgi:hypothetical protein